MESLHWFLNAIVLLGFTAIGIAAIYFAIRVKRVEAERQELHEELRLVATMLLQYRRTYYAETREVIEELINRLANGLPRFGAIVKPPEKR